MNPRPFKFEFIPPETINPPVAEQIRKQVQEAVEAAQREPVPPLRAEVLRTQINELQGMAVHLIELVQARAGNPTVDVNPNADPELQEALKRTYSEDNPPAAISMGMYSNLLDTRLAMAKVQLELADLDNLDGLQIDPLQKSSVHKIITAYEQAIVDTAPFHQQLAPLLSELKGDQLIFSTLDDLLSGYQKILPKTETDPTLGPVEDVSEDLYETLHPQLTGWQRYYAALGDIARKVDDVYGAVDLILRQYFYAPVAILMQIIALVGTLRALFHKPKLGEIRASAVWFIYPLLVAQVSIYLFRFDLLVLKVLGPIDRVLFSLDNMASGLIRAGRAAVGAVGKAEDAFETANRVQRDVREAGFEAKNALTTPDATAYLITRGGCTSITGAVNNRVNNGKRPRLDFRLAQYINALPRSLTTLRGTISWAVNEARRKPVQLQGQIQKLIRRRLVNGGDRLEALCTLRSLDATLTIFNAISVEMQRMGGPVRQAGLSLERNLETALNIPHPFMPGEVNVLQAIKDGSYMTMEPSGDAVQIRTAALPEPDPPTKAAFLRAGAQELETPGKITKLDSGDSNVWTE